MSAENRNAICQLKRNVVQSLRFWTCVHVHAAAMKPFLSLIHYFNLFLKYQLILYLSFWYRNIGLYISFKLNGNEMIYIKVAQWMFDMLVHDQHTLLKLFLTYFIWLFSHTLVFNLGKKRQYTNIYIFNINISLIFVFIFFFKNYFYVFQLLKFIEIKVLISHQNKPQVVKAHK